MSVDFKFIYGSVVIVRPTMETYLLELCAPYFLVEIFDQEIY